LAVGKLKTDRRVSRVGSNPRKSLNSCDVTQFKWTLARDNGGIRSRKAKGIQIETAKSKNKTKLEAQEILKCNLS